LQELVKQRRCVCTVFVLSQKAGTKHVYAVASHTLHSQHIESIQCMSEPSMMCAPADGSTVDIMDTTEQDPARHPASTPYSHPPLLQPSKELSPVEQFAQEVRRKAKWGPAVDVNVRGLMASAALTGQPVHIQLKNKEPVYLQGQCLHQLCVCEMFDQTNKV